MSVCLFIRILVWLFIRISVCLFIRMSICLFIRMSLWLYVRISVCPHVHMSVCPYVRISVCPYVHMSVCLYVSIDLRQSKKGGHISLQVCCAKGLHTPCDFWSGNGCGLWKNMFARLRSNILKTARKCARLGSVKYMPQWVTLNRKTFQNFMQPNLKYLETFFNIPDKYTTQFENIRWTAFTYISEKYTNYFLITALIWSWETTSTNPVYILFSRILLGFRRHQKLFTLHRSVTRSVGGQSFELA